MGGGVGKEPPGCDPDGRKEANMRYHKGLWFYKGKTYHSLHEALADNWPN